MEIGNKLNPGGDYLIATPQYGRVAAQKLAATQQSSAKKLDPETLNRSMTEMNNFYRKDSTSFTPLQDEQKDTSNIDARKPGEHSQGVSAQNNPVEASIAKLNSSGETDTITPKFTEHEIFSHFIDMDGKLTKEGEKLYGEIKAEFLDNVPLHPEFSKKPKIYFTGGIPASGKSTMIKDVLGDKPDVVWIDPDEMKKSTIKHLGHKFPGMIKDMENEPRWASVVHEVSSHMSKKLTSDALASGKDVLFDGVMKNPKKYREIAQKAKSMGYEAVALINDISPETAIKRANGRASKPVHVELNDGSGVNLPGRKVPESEIHESDREMAPTFKTLANEGLFDSYKVYNNDDNPSGKAMRVASFSKNGGLTVHDEILWHPFKQKGKWDE